MELGCVSAVDACGRTIWIVDAHRDGGKRFIVRADEKLTAFLELESTVCACGEFNMHTGIVKQYKAIPYMKIRFCLTRQIRTVP